MFGKFKKIANCELRKLTKKHIDKFFFGLKNSKISEETKYDYWIRFKVFIKWFKPKLDLSNYKLEFRRRRKIPEEILTLEEIRKIVLSAKSLRDRGMLSLFYDSGCRPSELVNLKARDILFDDDGLVVFLNGKTGQRRIRIITTLDSDKFLKEYLQFNQLNPEDYLFDRISIERLNQIVKEYARFLTEQQMKVYFGWGMDSKMVATYVHLSGRDLDSKVLELNKNDYYTFIPSESFKEFLFEIYKKWRENRGILAKI